MDQKDRRGKSSSIFDDALRSEIGEHVDEDLLLARAELAEEFTRARPAERPCVINDYAAKGLDAFAKHALKCVSSKETAEAYLRWLKSKSRVMIKVMARLLLQAMPIQSVSELVAAVDARLEGRIDYWTVQARRRVRDLAIGAPDRTETRFGEQSVPRAGRTLSSRDKKLLDLIGEELFRTHDNVEIARRFHKAERKQEFKTAEAFRAALNRIRRARKLPSSQSRKKRSALT